MASETLFNREIENDNNLFEVDLSENNKKKLPIQLFKEIEVELLDTLDILKVMLTQMTRPMGP